MKIDKIDEVNGHFFGDWFSSFSDINQLINIDYIYLIDIDYIDY